MSLWTSRPSEERSLLNPSFCSCLLWQAAVGHKSISQDPLPFELSFLVLPIVLHRATRDALPAAVRTSLAVWINDNPLARSRVADRSRMLVKFTKEAMMFGGLHGLLQFQAGMITANPGWKKLIAADMKDSTDEVRSCMKRAEFVGKWLASSGSSSTAMAIFGVRP
jgi:hypothetical protein